MTTIANLEKKSLKNSHYKRLIEGLNNEPFNYEWTGIVNDRKVPDGICVCGHSIRFEFVLEHKITKKIVVVGSTCVGTYQIFDKETTTGILEKAKEIQAEIRKRKSEAKKINQRKEIQILVNQRKPLLEKINYIKKLYSTAGEWMPYDLYKYYPVDSKKYVRFLSCIKALRKDIKKIELLINTFLSKDEPERLCGIIIEKEAKYEKAERLWIIEQQKEKERIENLKFIGKVGERTNFAVILIDQWLNKNYDTWIYKFEDKDGNIIIKWGFLTSVDFKTGQAYSFSAEVKKHSVWEKEKSTTITRLKNITEGEQLL